jgi:hypothetical protein
MDELFDTYRSTNPDKQKKSLKALFLFVWKFFFSERIENQVFMLLANSLTSRGKTQVVSLPANS